MEDENIDAGGSLVERIHTAWQKVLEEIKALTDAADVSVKAASDGQKDVAEVKEIGILGRAYRTIFQSGLDRLNFTAGPEEFAASFDMPYHLGMESFLLWLETFQSKELDFRVAKLVGALPALKARECGRCLFLFEHLFENGRYQRMGEQLLILTEGIAACTELWAAKVVGRQPRGMVSGSRPPYVDYYPTAHLLMTANEAFSAPSRWGLGSATIIAGYDTVEPALDPDFGARRVFGSSLGLDLGYLDVPKHWVNNPRERRPKRDRIQREEATASRFRPRSGPAPQLPPPRRRWTRHAPPKSVVYRGNRPLHTRRSGRR